MPAIRSLPPPSKKRKPIPSSIIAQIQSLESTLTDAVQSSASLNPLADLLNLAHTATDEKDVSKAIYALYRVFVVLVSSGKMSASTEATNEEMKVVRAWLLERLGAYQDLLVGLMKDEDAGLRVFTFNPCFLAYALIDRRRYLPSKFYSLSKNTSHPRSPPTRSHNSTYHISKRSCRVYSHAHHHHAKTITVEAEARRVD
jgi:U3 small nucleolar RNA-associated protein 19